MMMPSIVKNARSLCENIEANATRRTIPSFRITSLPLRFDFDHGTTTRAAFIIASAAVVSATLKAAAGKPTTGSAEPAKAAKEWIVLVCAIPDDHHYLIPLLESLHDLCKVAVAQSHFDRRRQR